MLQCQQHPFRAFCVTQIPDDWTQQVFFAQMMPCVIYYDVIHHPFPISSQYLRGGGLTALTPRDWCHIRETPG